MIQVIGTSGSQPRRSHGRPATAVAKNEISQTQVTAVPTADAVTKEPAMSRGQAFANLAGFLASLGVVYVAALLFTDQRTQQVDVSTVAVIALVAGLIGVAVAIGGIPDRPNPVSRESLAMLATLLPCWRCCPPRRWSGSWVLRWVRWP